MRFTFTQQTLKRLARKTRRKQRARHRAGWFNWRRMATQCNQSMMFRFTVFVAIAVFGAGYITAMSNVSTKGYEMREVEREIAEHKEANQRLRLEIAQHRSLGSIQSRIATIGLVPVEGITYISLEGSSVAQR